MLLDLTPDQVLTTTRSVRKRLDLTRKVPRALIEECLEIAFQAPNGSNMNTWQWVVVDDPALLAGISKIYDASLDDFLQTAHGQGYVKEIAELVAADKTGAEGPARQKMSESVAYLRQNMAKVPAVVIPMFLGRPDQMTLFRQASSWGSVLPAVWSLFLALRVRGLGSAWTTAHLLREREMAELLDIPIAEYTQVGLFPIAYTIGTDFHKAGRKPVSEVVSWNRFGKR
ncbi:MAG TPA: nitroreductase family protein [Alphaproteobacteria bacterium]|nr:nitroreductase family protein [Alphaproteobacteria bacterium]